MTSDRAEGALLKNIEKSLLEGLADRAHAEALKGERNFHQIETELLESMQPQMLELLPELILSKLSALAPEVLRHTRVADRGFERRNFKRWKSAFDALETMLSIADEVGEACAIEGNTVEMPEAIYRFQALSQLFPRALLVTREIIHLLKGGFPDGALSRWRTLHEIVVTAMFIKERGEDIALRYLASFDFQAKRAANQYNLYAERANLEPFSAEELAEIYARCDCARTAVGGDIKGDWGWASPDFAKDNPTFADIEKRIGMDHWRPRYKWASQHVHSGHRPGEKLLGMSESKEAVMLVGRSNSGFVDPLHMTAISLSQISNSFFLQNPNIDRVVYVRILMILSDQVGQLSIECDSVGEHVI